MGALTLKSPTDASSSFSIAPPAQQQALTQLPQPGSNSAAQSALMQGLTNYFKAQGAAAGDPNATPPSMMSSLGQSMGNAFDNSNAGGVLNYMGGNTAGNGYGAQAAAYGSGAAGGADAAGSSMAADGAAGGGAADALGSI